MGIDIEVMKNNHTTLGTWAAPLQIRAYRDVNDAEHLPSTLEVESHKRRL